MLASLESSDKAGAGSLSIPAGQGLKGQLERLNTFPGVVPSPEMQQGEDSAAGEGLGGNSS